MTISTWPIVIILALAEAGSPARHPAEKAPPPPVAESAPVEQRTLGMPVSNMKLSDMLDTFSQKRGERRHEATDIMAPRGTPVLAVEDGIVKKLFLSKPGGITIYEFEPSERYCYYYAHLDHYAANLTEGMRVTRGQVIGYVGSTGDAAANGPHLHFGITLIGPEKKWWGGTPIDPYPILRASFLKQKEVPAR